MAAVLAVLVTTPAHSGREQKDIATEETLNDKCRGGSGDDPQTWQACRERDALVKKLETEGWCWGHSGQIEADRQWELCQKATVPKQAEHPTMPVSGTADKTCLKTLKTHAFLTRAQFQCGFGKYSSKLIEDARACLRVLTDVQVEEQIKSGMAFFDNQEKEKGHAQICEDILKDFPSYVRQ
jgi:hypothetical protein